jgi:GTP-binding protein
VVVAITGRPNAGKSTLFNCLVRQRKAIVHDQPGVTRDDLRQAVERSGRSYELVDTGGIEEAPGRAGLAEQIDRRTLQILRNADVIVHLLDGRAGRSPADAAVAKRLRALGKPLLTAVNKIDQERQDVRLVDFADLGADELLAVSATHRRGIEGLWRGIDRLAGNPEEEGSTLPRSEEGEEEPEADVGPTRVALIGRPNVGKSSLLNRLAGFERALVDAAPGTTRDAIDVEIARGERRWIIVDTAGLRRPSRISEDLEGHAAQASLRALARTEVAILVLDATLGIADQDLRLADLAWRRGRGLVVAVNKIDLAPRLTAEQCQREIARRLPQWPPLPVVRVSAQSGEGMRGLTRSVEMVGRAYRRRMPTPQLNELLQAAADAQQPPADRGRPIKLRYGTQVRTAPQEVAVFVNRRVELPGSYIRYLTHALREGFELVGVPLRVHVRASERRGGETAPVAPRRRGVARQSRSR